jgi:hypothetical protein
MQNKYVVWCRTQDGDICELFKGSYKEASTEFHKCSGVSAIDVAMFGPIEYDYKDILKNNIDVTRNLDIEIYC